MVSKCFSKCPYIISCLSKHGLVGIIASFNDVIDHCSLGVITLNPVSSFSYRYKCRKGKSWAERSTALKYKFKNFFKIKTCYRQMFSSLLSFCKSMWKKTPIFSRLLQYGIWIIFTVMTIKLLLDR